MNSRVVAIVAGIILCIVGVVLWIGKLSLEHSMAIFLIIVGLFLALSFGFVYSRRSGV